MNSIPNRFSPWLIAAIALISMVGPFTIDTYLPSFPSIEQYFNINRALLSQSIGFYLLASGLASLFWGALSDNIGRRKVILGTLCLYLAASIGCAFAQEYSTFLLYRILQGIAASGGMVAGRAMIRDSFDPQQAHRAMAYVMMLFALAPAIAPIVGGWLQDAFGWRSVFYFLALYGLSILLMSHLVLSESLPKDQRHSFHPLKVLQVYFNTLKSIRFVAIIMSLSTCFSGLFMYVSGAPTIVFDILALDSHHFSVLFVPMTASIILGAFVSGKLSHNWPAKTIVIAALIIMSLASVLNVAQSLILSSSPVSVITPMALYAFGVALAMPGFTILALDCFPHNRGSASAMQGLAQTLLAALTTSLVIPLLSADILEYAIWQTLFLAMSLMFWLLAAQSKRQMTD